MCTFNLAIYISHYYVVFCNAFVKSMVNNGGEKAKCVYLCVARTRVVSQKINMFAGQTIHIKAL